MPFFYALEVIFMENNIKINSTKRLTLSALVIALYVVYGKNNLKEWQKWVLVILINIITFSADWSCIGVMIILNMYGNRGNVEKQTLGMMFWTFIYALVSFLFVNKVYGIIQLFVILVYPLLKGYNGERGKAKCLKWLFYIYYPLHLVIIGILRMLMYGNIPLLF